MGVLGFYDSNTRQKQCSLLDFRSFSSIQIWCHGYRLKFSLQQKLIAANLGFAIAFACSISVYLLTESPTWIHKLSLLSFLGISFFFLTLFHTTQFSHPIKLLNNQIKRISKGEVWTISIRDRGDEIGALAGSIEDLVSDRDFKSKTVRYLAFHEPLTGLANRASLQMDLEDVLAQELPRKTKGSLIFLDIDAFKELNDSLGFESGDQALRILADRISEALAAKFHDNAEVHTTIARTGSDEFVILLVGDVNADLARFIAELSLERIREPVVIDEKMAQLSASAGIAMFPQDGETFSDLMNAVDIALFNSKAMGKGTFRFYSKDMVKEDISSFQIKADFSQALMREDELELLYQPFVDLRTNKIVGGEALMRWHHPTLGTLEPSQFISVVENNEIALPADLWVIEQTLKVISHISVKSDQPFIASANISASNLARKQFSIRVAELVNNSGIDPKLLQLEITENFLHRDEVEARKSIEALKKLGVQVWLDDFGTGYSSLHHLQHFSVDGIKIDRQFVIKMQTGPGERMLVSAMLAMAKSFEMGVLAEGIDNERDHQILLDLGCNYGQGMLFSSPIKAIMFLELVQKNAKLPTLGLFP